MRPRGSQSRGGIKPYLIAIHTSEGAETAASLVNFLDGPAVEASYHVIVDEQRTFRYLDDSVASWSMLSGNNRSLALCFTGWARWTRNEWLAHPGMLNQGRKVVQEWCNKFGIPMQKLTPEQVGRDFTGICGHHDWTIGKRDGTHTDPGENFPWDIFLGGEVTTNVSIKNFRVEGSDILPIICPVGKASAITRAAWISSCADSETGTVHYWFQDDRGGISDRAFGVRFADGHSSRDVVPVPDGTTMIRVEHNLTGTVCLEIQDK